MRVLTLSLAKRKAVTRRALDAFSGKRRGAHISFASAGLLWRFRYGTAHSASWSWW